MLPIADASLPHRWKTIPYMLSITDVSRSHRYTPHMLSIMDSSLPYRGKTIPSLHSIYVVDHWMRPSPTGGRRSRCYMLDILSIADVSLPPQREDDPIITFHVFCRSRMCPPSPIGGRHSCRYMPNMPCGDQVVYVSLRMGREFKELYDLP
jgi:hypothetical protein